MRSSVREQPVDDQSTDREEEDEQEPEELMDGRAVGFEDLDCRLSAFLSLIGLLLWPGSYGKGGRQGVPGREFKGWTRRREEDVPNTMISKIKTAKPITPPPVPYFQAFSWVVSMAMGWATVRAKRKNWSRSWESAILLICFSHFSGFS
jgi:hypothetical protein